MLILLEFLRPDLPPWEYRNSCFLVPLCCLIVTRPNLEVASKRLLHQQVKCQGSFSAIIVHGGMSLQLFLVVWIFSKIPGCHLLQQMSSQQESQKLRQGLVSHELRDYLSVFNLILTQWIIVILSNRCKPDNFEVQILLNVNLSLNRTLPTFRLYMGENWMTWLILATSLWWIIFRSFERILLLM